MEQIPKTERKEKEPNLQEKISQIRHEISEIAKAAVTSLFEKRGLQPLNLHNGDLNFSETMTFGVQGTSSLFEDKIYIHEDQDINLGVYIHEMIHGYTNRYIHPDKRIVKSGICSGWKKEDDSTIYFLALNEALTEFLTDEALESTPVARYLELRKRLLEIKKEWLPLQFEALQAECYSDIDRIIEAMEAIPSAISDSDEDYEKWIEEQIECTKLMKENGLDFEFPTSRDDFIFDSWRRISEVRQANIKRMTARLELIRLEKKIMESRLEHIDFEIKKTFSLEKKYITERNLARVIVDKIAELKNETSQVILEKMKTAYLQGNTLYFRVIGKVLGKDILEKVAKLGDEVFEPSESDIEEADKIYGETEDVAAKEVLVTAIAKELAKKRFYKNLLERIQSIKEVQG